VHISTKEILKNSNLNTKLLRGHDRTVLVNMCVKFEVRSPLTMLELLAFNDQCTQTHMERKQYQSIHLTEKIIKSQISNNSAHTLVLRVSSK